MEPLRYPVVLFDAGDTLITPRESFGAVYARVLGALGVDLPADALEAALRAHWAEVNRALAPGTDRYGTHPGGEAGYWRRFVEGTLARTPGAPKGTELAERALQPLREAFREPAAWRVFEDVVPVLDALRVMGARLGVVSNWDSRLPALLEGLGLASRFDALVMSSAEGVEKPDPELFLRAMRRLGGRPLDTLHVGDVPELDEAGAAAAGIASMLVDRRGRLSSSRGALRDLASLPAIVRGRPD